MVPNKKGWAVRREGNKRVTAVYKYQDQAIRKAKRIAKKHKADVIIHRSDGTIRDQIGYDWPARTERHLPECGQAGVRAGR